MKFLGKRKNYKYKRIIAFSIVLMTLLSIPFANGESALGFLEGEIILATPNNKQQAQNELNELQEELEALEDEYNSLESQLDEKAAALSDLLAEKAILENDIAATQAAIDQATLDLEAAKAEEAKAYEAMKLRIQYMYENSTQDSIWDAILNSNSITDMLNRVEYVSQVHTTDRQMLEEYKAVVVEVETLKADLDASMESMVALQEVYEHQEADIQAAMAELEAESEDYATQIATAEARADVLSKYIREQNRLNATQNGGGSSSSGGGSGTVNTAGGYLNDPSYDPAFSSGVSGETLVNYALQFVGNPYVWGGNSLTNGCDCSGFVNLIYKHFGFTVPRKSSDFKYTGQPVAYENIKAGDIVVYSGHVAIYIGNGKIVEAQSSAAGITCTRRVNCSTILAIRRVL